MVFTQDNPPTIFSYLKGYDEMNLTYSPKEKYDVFIALDVSSLDRLGDSLWFFEQADKTICVDHHETNSGLADVKTGDTVTLHTNYGRFVYKVTEQIEFSKDDTRYLTVPKEGEYLTLYTCKPQVIGSADQRIGVRCEPVEKQFYTQSKQEGGKK